MIEPCEVIIFKPILIDIACIEVFTPPSYFTSNLIVTLTSFPLNIQIQPHG